MRYLTLLAVLCFSVLALSKEIKIPKSVYISAFRGPDEVDASIGPLWIDETPVTNEDYLKFVRSHPNFSKSKMAPLFADQGYLANWTDDQTFKSGQALFPVTQVSWFAARNYCASVGKRLPTIAEWEVATDSKNPEYEERILAWYAKPDMKLGPVGKSAGNRFGVKDAHGLIWEWVGNFSEAMMSGDSRGGSPTEALFCGGAALKAQDPKAYAAFVRFAYRSSLNAKYLSGILGFRCVRDIKEGSK